MAILKPYYGTQFTFKSLGSSYESNDGYVYGGNLGVNNLSVSISVIAPSQTDLEASGALSALAGLSGTGLFQLNDPSNFYADIWLNVDSYSNSYKLKDINDIEVKFSANHRPKALNWTGCYIDDSFIGNWDNTVSYNQYDIVYYAPDLLISNGGVVSGNLTERFFYCKAAIVGGNPLTDTGSWTQYDFPLDLEIDLETEFVTKNQTTSFKGAFDQRVPFGQVNPNRLSPISIQWKSLSTQEARCLCHFLENKQGYKRFNLKRDNVQWGASKVFVCQEWTHTIQFMNSHIVQATFVPDMRYKNDFYSGFPYAYTDLDPLMTAQWQGFSGIQ